MKVFESTVLLKIFELIIFKFTKVKVDKLTKVCILIIINQIFL